jgi:DNA-binding transcriptional regulator YiaG
MAVYFIQAGDDGLIKIGYAEDVVQRFGKMKVDSPLPLTILTVEDGSVEREAELHKRFSKSRERGEWFRPTDDLLDHIGTLPPFEFTRSRAAFSEKRSELAQWLVRNDLTLEEFAKLLGTTQATVSRWTDGINIPRRDAMRAIVQITNGEVQPSDFFEVAA